MFRYQVHTDGTSSVSINSTIRRNGQVYQESYRTPQYDYTRRPVHPMEEQDYQRPPHSGNGGYVRDPRKRYPSEQEGYYEANDQRQSNIEHVYDETYRKHYTRPRPQQRPPNYMGGPARSHEAYYEGDDNPQEAYPTHQAYDRPVPLGVAPGVYEDYYRSYGHPPPPNPGPPPRYEETGEERRRRIREELHPGRFRQNDLQGRLNLRDGAIEEHGSLKLEILKHYKDDQDSFEALRDAFEKELEECRSEDDEGKDCVIKHFKRQRIKHLDRYETNLKMLVEQEILKAKERERKEKKQKR